jgi:hypothetical protein
MLMKKTYIIFEHHDLDVYPIPKEKAPLFINEPWLIDDSASGVLCGNKEPEHTKDNVRIYVPLDINEQAILRRLNWIIAKYGEVNEGNESDFAADVCRLISQVEIYDQVWFERRLPAADHHSREAVELVKKFILRLEQIPDGCAEEFPFELIDDLKAEFLENG